MTKFNFRLQPLLKLRETVRDRCREELADAYRADQVLTDRQESILQEIDETKNASRLRSRPGPIEVDGLLSTHRYELMLTSQLQQVAAQREKVSDEIERRRQALVEADRELRILGKLRERYVREFRHSEEKLHTAQMDELALGRRRTMSGGDRS